MFSLNSRVTMNALVDVVGGSGPMIQQPSQNMFLNPQNSAWVDVTTRLKATMVDENDESSDDLENTTDNI